MRVLMISWEFPPDFTGGVASHVAGLTRGLIRAGHEVVVLTVSDGTTEDEETIHGVRILRARIDLPWLPENDSVTQAASANNQIIELIAHLDVWRPTIVHAHDWQTAWAANAVAKIFHIPLVATIHSTERGRHGGYVPDSVAAINSIEAWLALSARSVIGCSRSMVNEITEGFELPMEQVHLIPNGVDVDLWSPTASDKPREKLVLAWGRVQYEKGFQVLAQAIGRLRGRVPGIRCVIAGRGPYLPELQSQVDIEGVSDLVQLAGYVSDADLRSLLHRAGCVVIPSLYEPFGVVALESLASGAPTIVARTGGLAEIMQGSGAGLMFEPGDPSQLATLIEQVLKEQNVTRELQRNGAEVLRNRFSWDAVARSTCDLYNSTISGQ